MASVVTDPNGFKRVVFKGLDGKRRPIRLGKCSEKDAIAVAGHVEEIVKAAILIKAEARATSEWLADLSPIMEAKLVRRTESPEMQKPPEIRGFLFVQWAILDSNQ